SYDACELCDCRVGKNELDGQSRYEQSADDLSVTRLRIGGEMRVRSAIFFPALVLGLAISAAAQPSGKVVKVSTGEASYKIKRGATSQIAVVLDIDEGYHINSNRPAEKFLVATAFKLDAAP